MAYREVTMVEVKEVLRLWVEGLGKKRIGARLGLSPKTVGRYVHAAHACGLRREHGVAGVSEEVVAGVMASRRTRAHRPHGESWERCVEQREFIAKHLERRVRLSKIRKLLRRQGVEIPYPTLHRFAVATLGFGRAAPTVRLAEGNPGEECQVDTGWVLALEPDDQGKHRRRRAWIFTAVYSRHRFVWPFERETTESAIEACEAAWEFFGGVFRVLLPDNTKAIVAKPDDLEPAINAVFLEYAQARGFHVDPARVRHPKDKARVERSVAPVREDCYGGERLHSLEEARERGRRWSLEEYGMRRHSTTQRLPLEHFEAEEKPHLLPAPSQPYDVPLWCDPKVARDQHVQVARALYSLPTRFVGKKLRARADRTTVRLYDQGVLVKVHPRKPPGGRSTDPGDFPEHKTPYAMRDVAFLQAKATSEGAAIGSFAARVLDTPLPWTRMRSVYALLGLVRRYGAQRVEEACRLALAAEMTSVRRLQKMMAQPSLPLPPASTPAAEAPPSRYLRPAEHYAIDRPSSLPAEVSHGR